MQQVFSAFEKFAFRGINFWDRATRLEYWAVMPVIWGLIIWAFVVDAREIWEYLLRREIPPLNPLFYESIVLFFLTLVPRFSLTVRRLHDSGRSGKWATLPVSALISGIILMFGLSTFLITATDTGFQMLSIGIILGALVAGAADTFWEAAFGTAAALNAVGWDALWAGVAESWSSAPRLEAEEAKAVAGNVAQGLKESPIEGGSLLIAMIGTVATPFVCVALHLFFMLLPSDPEGNGYGESSVPSAASFRKGPTSHNPMEGYGHLFEKTPEEQAYLKQKQKEELKVLYRERVLGAANASTDRPGQATS